MIGSSFGHYRIEAELGAGGMGVVYRAFDTRLERPVAIKMLRGDDSVQEARSRLLHEARSASALNHPNVCTIYEVGEDADRVYIVMEYVSGQPVSSMLASGGIDVSTVIGFGIQIADALAHAHSRGVIHRDLKSQNVIVTDKGQVKVLDFGLAVRLPTADDLTRGRSLSAAGEQVVGTLAYMAPEIVRGRPATPVSDIWALGVMLFEMATGRPPFHGDTAYVVTGAILHEALPPLAGRVPPGLVAVIERSLVKDPIRRYQGATEVRAALEAAQAGGLSGVLKVRADDRRSILVLPFTNLVPHPEGDYFSDGLTDEVITDLSSVRNLRVISRTSSMRLKGASQDIGQLAASLGVQYVLEGSVRASGSQFRVTAKLIDTASDSLVWGQKYAGSLEEVFAIQESISRAIVEALRVTLSADEDRRLAAHPIRDVQAFEAYLRAKQEAQRFTRQGLDRAVEYLEKASAIEGDNVVLLAARGQAYWQYINAGLSADLSYLDRADDCAARVLALDPESPLGHRLAGLVQVHRGDMAASLRSLKRSLDREPNDPDTLFWAAIAAGVYGLTDLALTWATRLVEIDPLTPVHHFAFGVVAILRGDFPLALATFAQHYQSVLDTPPARLVYGQALSLNGRLEEAFGIWRDLERDMPDSPFSQLGRFYRLALEGKPDEAAAVMTPEVVEAFRRDPQYAWLVAECYAIAGDVEQALTWTETAVACGLHNRRLLQEFDPFLAPIRDEPRFRALMRDVERREKGTLV